MMSLNLNKRCLDRLIIEPATVEDNNDDHSDAHCNPRSRKARRLNTSAISCSPKTRAFPTIITPPSLSLSSLLQQQTGVHRPVVSDAINATFPVPVLSPATYLSMALQNQKHGPSGRIEAFSLEQALYFAPYTTGELSLEVLRALRQFDLPQLRTLLVQQEQDQQDDPQENFKNMFHQRNSFGENLLHLACRMGVPQTLVQFLVDEAHVPLNVRDRWGRSPLHQACWTGRPQFTTLVYLFHHPVAVLQVRMEDDTGKVPFELIPARCYARWTRFLAEQHILPRVAQQLAASSSSSIPPATTSSTKSPTTTTPIIRAAATNDAVTRPPRPVTIEDEEDENDEHDDADAFLAALMPLWPC